MKMGGFPRVVNRAYSRASADNAESVGIVSGGLFFPSGSDPPGGADLDAVSLASIAFLRGNNLCAGEVPF